MKHSDHRVSRAALLLATVCAAGSAREMHAGSGVWTTSGPAGTNARALALDPVTPSTVYAAAGDVGLLKSTDAGTTWTLLVRNGLSPSLRALAVSPSVPSTLYAGSADVGVLKSTDGGGSWALANVGMAAAAAWSRPVNALVIEPGTPSTVYQACGLSLGGLYKSTDAGGSWAPAVSGLPSASASVRSLAIDPVTPANLYAGLDSSGGGVFKSTNGGGGWVAMSTGLPASQAILALAVDPVNPAILYAGVNSSSVYRSTNAGLSWSSAGTVGLYVRALAVDSATPATVYAATSAGVYKSTNSGGSWLPMNTGLASPDTSALVLVPGAPATVYAGTAGGVFKSTNAAGAWAHATSGVSHRTIRSLGRDPLSAATVYAGSDGGAFFKSTDTGGTWTLSNLGLASTDAINAIVIDPTAPATLYAGTSYRVSKSTNGGATWADSSTGFTGYTVFGLVMDPTVPTTLYATMFGGGVTKSTNGGASWNDVNGGLPSFPYAWSLALDPSTPATLYLGTTNVGAYKSTNGGGSWSPAGLTSSGAVWALAVDPVTPVIVYAGTDNGVFKSTDAGGSWNAARTGLPAAFVPALAVDPTAAATLYAAAGARRGIFKSTDAGATWASIGAGLRAGIAPTALLLDTSAGTRLYAGMYGDSVWQASPPPAAFLKGDVDGDGARDLAFRSNVNPAQNKLWLMNGVVRTSEAAVTPDAASADWKIRGVDDFDNDGRNDLVFWNQATGNVEFWLMNGTARVGAAVPLSGGPVLDPGWDLSATADFDQDGATDLVWRNFTSQKIVIWTMNGTAKVGSRVPTPDQAVDGNWSIVAALDYNNDGAVDFLWYNATSGRIVSWYMNAALVRSTGQFTTPMAAGDNNWRVVASSDYSRASVPATPPLGSADIVWRNETSGNQVVWHMDFASTRVHGEFTTPTANTPALDWTIVGPR